MYATSYCLGTTCTLHVFNLFITVGTLCFYCIDLQGNYLVTVLNVCKNDFKKLLKKRKRSCKKRKRSCSHSLTARNASSSPQICHNIPNRRECQCTYFAPHLLPSSPATMFTWFVWIKRAGAARIAPVGCRVLRVFVLRAVVFLFIRAHILQ